MTKPLYRLLPLAILTAVASFFLFSGTSHAASITVATGNDETTTNSSCSLSEAINNINDQTATYPDCAAGDGINDSIVIPAGTITLTGDLPQATQPIRIQGAGMKQSIISGDSGLYIGLDIQTSGDVLLKDFGIKGIKAFGCLVSDANLTAENLEFDGNDSLFCTTFYGWGSCIGGHKVSNTYTS